MNLSPIQKKWLYRALIALIFIFAFAIRSNNLSGKNGMHIDEYWSFILSEYKDVGWTEDIPEGVYTAGELKAMVYAPTDSSFKGAMGDVFKLWETNRDSPHTNLYYSALRLSLIGVESSDNLMQELVFRAGVLNLLTFTVLFFAFFVFLRLLSPRRSFILLGLVVLSLNPFDIGNILFFRPYIFQTLFVVVFTSYLIYITKQLRADVYKDSWQNLIKFAFAMSLMLWAGYYGFVYGFFVGLAFVLFVLRPCKKLNLVPFFLVACLVAVAFDCIYYQEFFKGFYEYQALNSASNVSSFLGNLANIYAKMAKYNLHWIFMVLFPMALIFVIVAFKKRHSPFFAFIKEYYFLIGATVFACLVISFISPIKIPRYLVPFMSMALIAIPLLCAGVKSKAYRQRLSGLIAFIFVIMALFSVKINKAFNMDYKFNHYGNSNFTGIKRADLPVYLTKAKPIFIFADLNNGLRAFCIAAMDNDLKVIVCDIECYDLPEADAFEKMRESYDMPKDFILIYCNDTGKYKPHTCEL